MASIFITGSSDGLGLLAARALIKQGHRVVLHARNEERGKQALDKAPGAADVLIADLSIIEETKALALKANATGRFDSVIHNAGVYRVSATTDLTADGLPVIFAVNSLAPYILTCLMLKPKRLIYLSSDMHPGGNPNLDNLISLTQKKNLQVTYSDTKLHIVMLAMATARKWTDVIVNAVNPGWVPTRMGGAGAPDSLEKGFETQVWLAVSNDPEASVSGCYFYHQRQDHFMAAAKDVLIQERFLTICEQITGIPFE